MNALNKDPCMQKRIKRIIPVISLVFVFGLLGSYIGLRIWIKSDIDRFCNNATSQYNGDRLDALISLINSETQSLKDKNDAIWTLAYIGDRRALPVLKNLLTGKECDHSRYVCQRQLKRTIGYIEGTSVNIMKFK
jgi:hypothetical protein